jgi:GNAT superfamily N-acetyltransferase
MNPTPDAAGAIRPATCGDVAMILEVVRSSSLFAPDELAHVAATLDRYIAEITDGGCWLVYDRSGIAGVAYYAPEAMTAGTWNLFMWAVSPHRQGQGVGAALVRSVEQDLHGRGARVLLIETSGVSEFSWQRAFYTDLGYVQEAVIRDFYDTGDDKVVFYKALGDHPQIGVR